MNISLLYRDSDSVVINKPSGLLVHTFSHQSETETVVAWAREKFPEITSVGDDTRHRPGIVHRLDRETSGALIIARNQDFFLHIKNQFLHRKVGKIYYAIVHGAVERGGKIDAAIGLVRGSTRRSTHGQKMRKEASTSYEPVSVFEWRGGTFSLVRVIPHTGRTHQIRVHMNSIHHPVVGDVLYGKKKNKDISISSHLLHCASLSFETLEGKSIVVEAPLPDEMKEIASL